MTPLEKAKELYSMYYNRIEHTLSEEYSPHEKDIVKECALILTNIMLDNAGFIWGGTDTETGKTSRDMFREYWMEVKQEIEKL